MKSKSKNISSLESNTVKNYKEGMDKESFVRQAVNFLRENKIISDYDINNMIISTYVASEKIKDVEIVIDKKNSMIMVSAYISRWSYLFSNKQKIINQIVTNLQPIVSNGYILNVEVRLDRYDNKEKK